MGALEAGVPAPATPDTKTPTPEQWQAIETVDRHLLVAAGAGTGKTFTVVAKIAYLLGIEVNGRTIARPLSMAQIAAITFTNQAAAELKERVRAALRDAGRRDLAYEVDLARVGTIHSFCGEILRDFSLRAGRAPAGRILEEGEAGALAAEVVRDALVEALETGRAPGLEALLTVWSARDVQAWATLLLSRPDRLSAYEQSVQPGSHESAVLKLARLAHERLQERLEQQGAVDFDRMIGWTRELLEDAAVCDALRRRIRVLIVDEFQDTDPLQKEIAYRLGDPGSGRADTTRLVLVGDPKQSIYRFRRADVTVWNAVARDFQERGLGRVLPLSENRRSLPGILAFVDATVGRALAQPVAGEALQPFEVAPQPLSATRAGDDTPAVELLVTPADAEGKTRKAEAGRRIEAEGVAWRMQELHAQGYDWGEMALLLASWSDMALYEGAMRRRGIPCYPLMSDGFYERSEITDIIVALEAVRDPTDDRALFGFLRGPFVGVSDETLLRIAMQGGTPYWRAIDQVRTPDDDLLRRGVALLKRHSALRDRISVARLVEGLLEESGYLAHLALLTGEGEQAIANVRRLIDLLRAAQEATLGEVLRRIGDERARGDRVAQARLHGEKDDVVLISSVHSAKGLEWRAVFWGDLGREANVDYGRGIQIGRDALVLGDPELSYKEQAESWLALWQRDQEERAAEAKRMWYVAATRARDLLVLSGIPLGEKPRIKGSPAEMLRAALPSLGEAAQLKYAGDDGRPHVARVRRLDDAVAQAEAALHAPVVEGPVGDPAALAAPPLPVLAPLGRGRHSATELMVFERCPRRHWLRYIAGIREPALALGGPSWKSAAVRGTVVHDVLEHLREEEDADALLEDAIERHAPDAPAEDAPAGSRYRTALRREIARVAQNPEYRALADHPQARRELPFLFILGEGRYAEGFFDLAAPGSAGLTLLDVKTGETPVEEAVHKYATQRDVYTSAAAAIAGVPVSSFLFAFSHGGSVIDAALALQEAEAARARVAEAVARIEAGERALRSESGACEWCAYRKVGVCGGAAVE